MVKSSNGRLSNRFKVITTLTSFLFLSLLVFPLKAEAAELNVYGATATWSDKLYKATGCSQYDFSYNNASGIRLLSLSVSILDPYGQKLADNIKVGLDNGLKGTFNLQICSFAFTAGLGPYTVKLSIQDYAGSTRQGTKEFYFLEIPNSNSGGSTSGSTGGGLGASPAPTVTVTAKPVPAPTVTVTAAPAPAPTVTVTASAAPIVDPYFKNEATRLQAELSSLRSDFDAMRTKLTKICKVKPKPKYC